jgi:hypothetical protein
MECSTIKREHEAWRENWMELATLGEVDNAEARFRLSRLSKSGETFAKATRGYDDEPAKNLAVAVAAYNVAVGFVSLDVDAGAPVSLELHGKALAASREVNAAYATFASAICG